MNCQLFTDFLVKIRHAGRAELVAAFDVENVYLVDDERAGAAHNRGNSAGGAVGGGTQVRPVDFNPDGNDLAKVQPVARMGTRRRFRQHHVHTTVQQSKRLMGFGGNRHFQRQVILVYLGDDNFQQFHQRILHRGIHAVHELLACYGHNTLLVSS